MKAVLKRNGTEDSIQRAFKMGTQVPCLLDTNGFFAKVIANQPGYYRHGMATKLNGCFSDNFANSLGVVLPSMCDGLTSRSLRYAESVSGIFGLQSVYDVTDSFFEEMSSASSTMQFQVEMADIVDIYKSTDPSGAVMFCVQLTEQPPVPPELLKQCAWLADKCHQLGLVFLLDCEFKAPVSNSSNKVFDEFYLALGAVLSQCDCPLDSIVLGLNIGIVEGGNPAQVEENIARFADVLLAIDSPVYVTTRVSEASLKLQFPDRNVLSELQSKLDGASVGLLMTSHAFESDVDDPALHERCARDLMLNWLPAGAITRKL